MKRPPKKPSPEKPSPQKPPSSPPSGSAFTDVNSLSIVSPAIAQEIVDAAMQAGQALKPEAMTTVKFVTPALVTKPGTERWTVKTGQDGDIGEVAKNIIDGKDLGAGIVPATVEQLIHFPRPSDMTPPTSEFPAYESKRSAPVELTVWQLTGDIIFLKLEADGDYHMVLQGTSGLTLIVEVPTPTTTFVGSSPWLANIKTARDAVDGKLVSHLSPNDFVPMDGYLVPSGAVPNAPQVRSLAVPASFVTPQEGEESSRPAFMTAIKSTPAKITGVGFFDKIHGQTGVSQLNGIELHPVLKIEWL